MDKLPVSSRNKIRQQYCGKDTCYTLTVAKVQAKKLASETEKLQEFYKFQQEEVCKVVVTMMNRGVRIDTGFKNEMHQQFTEIHAGCIEKLNWVFNEEINLNSTPQVKRAFKDMLGIVPIKDRKTKAESFGAEAMLVYLDRYPEYRSLLTLFLESKSIKVFLRTFLNATLSDDGRMRCSYNPAGTKTYRFSSRKGIDGTGTNLANVPSKGKIDLRYSLQDIPGEEDIADLDDDPNAERLGKIALPNCKKMFIPDPDMIIADADYSAIDLMFVIWESDCQFLKKIVKAGDDVYSILASHYYQKEITKAMQERQIFKAICHGCLTGEHEVLTPNGWVALEDLEDSNKIAVWSKDTKDIHFEVPKGINRDYVDSDEDLYEISGAAFHQVCTQDHTFPYTTDKPDALKSTQAINLPKSARLPYNGNFVGGNLVESTDYMRLIAALQADGNINHIAKDGTVTYRFRFVRERKIVRMRQLLVTLGIDFKEWAAIEDSAVNNEPRVSFSFQNILKPEMKKLGWWILDYSKECINAWLDELQYWDGHIRTSNGVRTSISTTDQEAAEIIQTVAHLCGRGSKILREERDSTRQTLYEVSLNVRKFHNMATGNVRKVSHSGTMVYCPKTTTGFFMVRYKGNVMVTGNSNYLGRAPTLAAKAGLAVGRVKQVQDWYFSQCKEIPQWHSRIANDCKTRRYTENVFGARFWCVNPNDRDDPMWLNKVVASVPQSSAAILVNKAICNLEATERGKIQTLLQVHDSLVVQYHKDDVTAPERILKYMAVEIPYPNDPLVIPAALKVSAVSYGDCH